MTYVVTIHVRGFKAFNKKRKEAALFDRIKELTLQIQISRKSNLNIILMSYNMKLLL